MHRNQSRAKVQCKTLNDHLGSWRRGVLALASASLFASSMGSAHAAGASEGSARASEMSAATLSMASGVLIGGTLSTVVLSGQAIVAGIETIGESVVVTLTASGNAATATVRLSGRAAAEAGLVAGGVVMVSAAATGIVLRSAGRIVCFIPNERGRALIRSRRVDYKPID